MPWNGDFNPELYPLTADDIAVGTTYRAKKPQKNFLGEYNDRTVLYVSPSKQSVQYDGPAVAMGRHYPKVTMEKFLKWAAGALTPHRGAT